jgi:hypothetical protein
MSYQTLIKRLAPAANVRHVEAWMRVDHGTLDHLSADHFRVAVSDALYAIAQTPEAESEALAKSYGL